MAEILKVKANQKDGITQVQLVASHVMESGQRADENGNLIPAIFLQELKVSHAGKTVFIANLGTGVSENPFLVFSFSGGTAGDELTIDWVENTGKRGSETATIK